MLQERIHRPPTAEQAQEKKEWKELCRKSGVTVVGSPEWYEKIAKENGQEDANRAKAFFGKGQESKEDGKGKSDDKLEEDPFAWMKSMAIVVGKPVTLGEVIMAEAAANEKSKGEAKEKGFGA